jgi:acyl dehydratase
MTNNALISTTAKYFDDLELGQTWETAARTITETDVVLFACWSGDNNPLHVNEEFAKTTPFGRRLFHGPAALAVAFGLEAGLGWKMGTAIAFLGINDWNMRAPVFIGDTIRVREEITELRPSSSKPDRGVVRSRVQILNQRDEVCQDGDWLVLMSRNGDAA